MAIGPLTHEYTDQGVLRLESKISTEQDDEGAESYEMYWMGANFESLDTGATYRAEFDDSEIRRFSTILNFDPDLLDDFLQERPAVTVLSNTVWVEFSLRLGSKHYRFTIEIPKFVPEVSVDKMVEQYQKNNVLANRVETLKELDDKNNILTERVKTLEERIEELEIIDGLYNGLYRT